MESVIISLDILNNIKEKLNAETSAIKLDYKKETPSIKEAMMSSFVEYRAFDSKNWTAYFAETQTDVNSGDKYIHVRIYEFGLPEE